ncbi:Protein of unknown function [Gryllus bimaculatus]|nr:Protein of unknown function [Gryllus bimaculatus]
MFQLPMHISLSSPAAREWIGQRRENNNITPAAYCCCSKSWCMLYFVSEKQ